MRIYYFIHLTGRELGNSGIQRVVRNLGTALQAQPAIELYPVRWSEERQAIVHAEENFFERIQLFNGPKFTQTGHEGKPIHLDAEHSVNWLLVPEVPLFQSPDPRYPFVHIPYLLGYAKTHGIRSAFIFYDILPLSHFGEDTSTTVDALKFIVYANGLAQADVVLPISIASEEALKAWFSRCGLPWDRARLMRSILLPEQMVGEARGRFGRVRNPRPLSPKAVTDVIEFCMWGSIQPHKNQTAVMAAFNALQARRHDLHLRLHQFGNVAPQLAAEVSRLVRQSAGGIRIYGFINDDQMADVIRRCRATVFASLAEGYGLPLAESLWMGKPCLTSNVAPMTEIASGGGCMLVDPFNVVDIETGLERLATDDELIDRLHSEIAARPMRDWGSYASKVLAALHEQDSSIAFASLEGNTFLYNQSPCRALPILIESVTFRSEQFAIHHVYGNASPSMIQKTGLHFIRSEHDSIDEPVLCFGPFFPLERGWYVYHLNGKIVGEVMVRITSSDGRILHVEKTIKSESETILFHVRAHLDRFELLLIKTERTTSVLMRSIYLNRYSGDFSELDIHSMGLAPAFGNRQQAG